MTILALDCSTNVRTAAIFRGNECVAELRREEPARTFSSVILVQDILRAANLKARDLTRLVIGLGPGSYTGIRSCIAVGQGLQLAWNIPAQGINSFDAMAHGAWKLGMRGPVRIALDAQRSELYIADYLLSEATFEQREQLQIVSIPEASKEPSALAGPGLHKLREDGIDLYPEARSLAEMAIKLDRGESTGELEPVYARPMSFVKATPPRWA